MRRAYKRSALSHHPDKALAQCRFAVRLGSPGVAVVSAVQARPRTCAPACAWSPRSWKRKVGCIPTLSCAWACPGIAHVSAVQALNPKDCLLLGQGLHQGKHVPQSVRSHILGAVLLRHCLPSLAGCLCMCASVNTMSIVQRSLQS